MLSPVVISSTDATFGHPHRTINSIEIAMPKSLALHWQACSPCGWRTTRNSAGGVSFPFMTGSHRQRQPFRWCYASTLVNIQLLPSNSTSVFCFQVQQSSMRKPCANGSHRQRQPFAGAMLPRSCSQNIASKLVNIQVPPSN